MSTKIKINPDYNAIAAELAAIATSFAEGKLIYSGRNELRRLTIGGHDLVVKRFGRLPWFRRVIYSYLCSPKARRAYDYGMKYISLGFATPMPVAAIEISDGGLLADSFFVCEYTDAPTVYSQLVEPERFDPQLADEVALLMHRLHAAGAVHGDPNLNNVLLRQIDDVHRQFLLIDTNRSHFGRKVGRRRRLANVMRVTHRRDLLRQVAGRYAALCGYDPVATVDDVMHRLDRFERNRRIRHAIKAALKW